MPTVEKRFGPTLRRYEDFDKMFSGQFTDAQTPGLIRRGPVDAWLLGAVLLLVLSGELFVFNTTYFYAFDRFDDPYLFVWKHNVALVIGCLGCLVALALPSTVFRTLAYPALIVAFIILCLVLLPSFSHGKVQRWLSFGALNFQPSEFAKGAVVLYLASTLTKKADRIHSFMYGLLPPLLVVGCVAVLIALEPDLGGGRVHLSPFRCFDFCCRRAWASSRRAGWSRAAVPQLWDPECRLPN